MILMPVGDGNDVEVFVAARPEIRGDGFFAGVDAGVFRAARKSGEGAPAVDEERPAGGGDEEEGIALADVEDGEFHLATMPLRRKRERGDDSGGDKECDAGGDGERRAPTELQAHDGGASDCSNEEKNYQRRRGTGNRIVPVNQAREKGYDVQQERGKPSQGDGEKFSEGG